MNYSLVSQIAYEKLCDIGPDAAIDFVLQCVPGMSEDYAIAIVIGKGWLMESDSDDMVDDNYLSVIRDNCLDETHEIIETNFVLNLIKTGKTQYSSFDYNLVRNIGDVNFKKHFKPMCGLFEKDNGKVGRRYLVERYYNKTTKKYEYYKYFYDDHNWIDIFSKIKISKEDYEKMGGENREYISSLYFDMV